MKMYLRLRNEEKIVIETDRHSYEVFDNGFGELAIRCLESNNKK